MPRLGSRVRVSFPAPSFFVETQLTASLFFSSSVRLMAGCQSGYVAACKAAYAGSIPAPAFVEILSFLREGFCDKTRRVRFYFVIVCVNT